MAITTERLATKFQAAYSGFGLERMPNMIESLANKSLERTVEKCGRTVRAVALCARAGAEMRSRAAVQHNR